MESIHYKLYQINKKSKMFKDIKDQPIQTNAYSMESSLISRETFSESLQQTDNQKQTIKPQRLNSLDVHRGLTMFGMMLANLSQKPKPSFLQHAQWNGLTCADLVFPTFIFIIGMSIPLALKNIIRIVALYAIGLGFNLLEQHFEQFHVAGVLQRLIICYGYILLIHWATEYGKTQKRIFGALIIMTGFLVYISYMMIFTQPEIGCFKQNNLTRSCNMSGWLEYTVFGKNHTGGPSDPESHFANLSAFVTCYIGYYFCLIMKYNKSNINKTLKQWFLICIILGVSVYPLTKMMPISKRIYSASFAILNACISGMAIFSAVILIDILPQKFNKVQKVVSILIIPFVWLGRNPLFVYVLHELVNILSKDYIQIDGIQLKKIIQKYLLQSWIGQNEVSSVINALIYITIYTLICGLLYKKNIFIRL